MGKIIKGLLIAAAIIFIAFEVLTLVVVSAATAATICTVANALALSAVLNGIAETLAPRARLAGSAAVQSEYSGTLEARRIIYGRMRVSGMNCIPPITTGTDNQMLHQVLVVAGHEIDAFESFMANQEAVTAAATTGTASDGLVSSGTYASNLWVRAYRGTATQTVDFILNAAWASYWTSFARLRGLAYIALQFKFSSTKFASGKPEITTVVRGKKVYDPRLDVAPGASPTNAAYIAWSMNPALINADYLLDTLLGRKVPASRINWTDVVTAANICDTSVAGGNAPPSGAQPLYTCNVVLAAAATPEEHDANQSTLASAMMGVIYRSGGVWRMFAGVWTTSAFAITQDDVIGTVHVETEIPLRSKFNSIKGSYLSAASNYQQTEFQPIVSSAYIATDTVQRWKEVQFPCVVTEYEAQRNALFLLKQSRDRRSVAVECQLSAAKVRVWETGTLTLPELGWTNQTVRCLSWALTPEGKVSLLLKEESSADWTLPLTAAYVTAGTASVSTPGLTRPGTPASLVPTSVATGITFSIGASDPYINGQVYRLWENTAGAGFATATPIAETVGSTITVPKADLIARDYWATARFAGQEALPTAAASGAAGTVGSTQISVSSLSSISPSAGTITAGMIQNASGSTQFDLTNGRIIFDNGTYMKVTGIGFGTTSDLLEWYGPHQASITTCSKTNAVFYLSTTGSTYFGGVTNAPKSTKTYTTSVAGVTETAPLGVTKATIEIWGGSGAGGGSFNAGYSGASGGSGGYARSSISITPGQTLTITTGNFGSAAGGGGAGGSGTATTVVAGTATLATMSAGGGGGGASGISTGAVAGTAGSVGTGGNEANLAGIAGNPGIAGTSVPSTGGVAGFTQNGPGGGMGFAFTVGAGNGGSGNVVIRYF